MKRRRSYEKPSERRARMGQSHALGVFQGLDHVGDQFPDFRRARVLDLLGAAREHGMAHAGDLQNGHALKYEAAAARGKADSGALTLG